MERLDGSSAVPAPLRGGIVALGNFDGFPLSIRTRFATSSLTCRHFA
jgi:hypothetical protein